MQEYGKDKILVTSGYYEQIINNKYRQCPRLDAIEIHPYLLGKLVKNIRNNPRWWNKGKNRLEMWLDKRIVTVTVNKHEWEIGE